MKYLRLILDTIKSFAQKGLFHIVGSSVLSQLCGLISSIVVIRHLSKVDYGYYVEASNLYAYFAIFIGMGYATALLQFCSENIEDTKKSLIYRFTLLAGTVFNNILAVLIFVFGAIKGRTNPEVGYYIKLMCFLPFVGYLCTYFQMVFRIQGNNKFYSLTNGCYSVSIVVCNILFTYLWGIKGLVMSMYVANIVIIVIETAYLYKTSFFMGLKACHSNQLDKDDRNGITRYALTTSVTNFASTILILLDVTCLGLVLHTPEILADYKVAASIPNAFGFIPSALMIFFYPELVRKFSGSYNSLISEIRYLSKIYLFINGAVFIVLFLFSKQIIFLVYGEKYLNVVPIFRILSLNYLLGSCGRKILGNAVAVTRRVQINLYFSIISGIINILLNIILISAYGSIGAAIATLFVTATLVLMYIVFFYIQWKKENRRDEN